MLKYSVLLGILFYFFWWKVFAAEYINVPDAKQFPHSNSYLIQKKVIYTLSPDGRISRQIRVVRKLFNHYAFAAFGDPILTFHRKNQDLKILKAETHTPDGRLVKTKANGLNRVTPAALEKAPDYTDIQQLVVTHVGIEKNAVIVLEYQLKDRRKIADSLDGLEFFEELDPVGQLELIVRVPSDTPLKYQSVHQILAPQIEKKGDYTQYRWLKKDIPGMPLTEGFNHPRDFLPGVVFSTEKSWLAIHNRLLRRFSKAANRSKALKKTLQDLLQSPMSKLDQVLTIALYIRNNINSVTWDLGDFNARIRLAGTTFETTYGHALDKAVLLCAALASVGVKAYPIFVTASSAFSAEVPSLRQFSEIRVGFRLNGTERIINPFGDPGRNLLSELQGKTLLRLLPARSLPRRYQTTSLNTSLLTGTVKLYPNLKIRADFNIKVSGRFNPDLELYQSKAKAKGVIQRLLAEALPGANLKAYHQRLQSSGTSELSLQGEKVLKSLSGFVELKLGQNPGISALGLGELFPNDRKTPIILAEALTLTTSLKILLAPGFKPVYLPKPVQLKNALGQTRVTYLYHGQTRVIVVQKTLHLKAGRILPDQYPQFKEMIAAFVRNVKNRVMLKAHSHN